MNVSTVREHLMIYPRTLGACVAATLALISVASLADEPMGGKNVADVQFIAFEGMPTCTTGAVQKGDPGKESSIILARAEPGCVVPWHWHTPAEHLMIVTGDVELQMKDGAPFVLHAGGFAVMPAHHLHLFHCVSKKGPCLFYVYSDGPFDIHYVNAQGDEIPAAEALAQSMSKK
jgi:quercetin dioxygenase-like cupin family protein